LKKYPTEQDRKIYLKVGEKTGRKWAWFYKLKIGSLRDEIIQWPDEWNTTFTVTVDGVHFQIHEPSHEEFKRDPKYFSHKFGKAGLDYEIAISVYEQKVVWANGPFRAGKPDIEIFNDEGLRAKIPPGKKVIADRGYRGQYNLISIRNSLDTDEVRTFKSRALSRHENFNYRMERYKVLDEAFRHDFQKHKVGFDAVLVICQLELQNGSPLFAV
jgi:hypothetical protein